MVKYGIYGSLWITDTVVGSGRDSYVVSWAVCCVVVVVVVPVVCGVVVGDNE